MALPVHPASCIFCDIVKGAAEVSVCHEDAIAVAFMDHQPVNPGHVLVVPRAHYETLVDVPRDVGQHLYEVATRLIPVIQKVTGCADMNIVVNSGRAAGQDVMHFHLHLIPRAVDDGFDIPLPFPGSAMPERTKLDMTAAMISAAIHDPMRKSPARGTAVVA